MDIYFLYIGLSFHCTDISCVFKYGDQQSQKRVIAVCNDKMPERDCRSEHAGSVLRFYLWKEEKAELLRKSRVRTTTKQCGTEAGK